MPFANSIKDAAFRARCTLRNAWPVWYYLLNRESRVEWDKARTLERIKKEHPVVQRIIEQLKRDGVAAVDISELFPEIPFAEVKQFAVATLDRPGIQEEIAEHKKMIRERIDTNAERAGNRKRLKDFIVESWGSTGNNTLPGLDSPFICMNLDPRVLAIAGSYIGVAPKFRAFSLRMTIPVPSGTTEYFSQRWHRDPEDRNMLKMFVYMTDVLDEAAGPFIYIRGSQPGGALGRIFPQRPPSATYPELGAVEKEIPASNTQTCFGKAGTILFADTSGLHKGGYSTSNPRLMYTGTFYSHASIAPHHLAYDGDISKLSPLGQYALRL